MNSVLADIDYNITQYDPESLKKLRTLFRHISREKAVALDCAMLVLASIHLLSGRSVLTENIVDILSHPYVSPMSFGKEDVEIAIDSFPLLQRNVNIPKLQTVFKNLTMRMQSEMLERMGMLHSSSSKSHNIPYVLPMLPEPLVNNDGNIQIFGSSSSSANLGFGKRAKLRKSRRSRKTRKSSR